MQALGGPGRPATDTKQRLRGEVVIDGVTYTYVLYKRKPRWSLVFSPGYDGANQGTASYKKGDEADAATICTRIREALERAAQRKTAAVTAATPTAPAQELSPMRTSTATRDRGDAAPELGRIRGRRRGPALVRGRGPRGERRHDRQGPEEGRRKQDAKVGRGLRSRRVRPPDRPRRGGPHGAMGHAAAEQVQRRRHELLAARPRRPDHIDAAEDNRRARAPAASRPSPGHGKKNYVLRDS